MANKASTPKKSPGKQGTRGQKGAAGSAKKQSSPKQAATTKVASSASTRSKGSANHPKYSDMVMQAIEELKERSGSSRQAILKYVLAHFNVGQDSKGVNTHLKMALKRGITSGDIIQSKGKFKHQHL